MTDPSGADAGRLRGRVDGDEDVAFRAPVAHFLFPDLPVRFVTDSPSAAVEHNNHRSIGEGVVPVNVVSLEFVRSVGDVFSRVRGGRGG